jgi:DHA1 family bicyclomycin/chloramphenicol resistance-like MFS transporter
MPDAAARPALIGLLVFVSMLGPLSLNILMTSLPGLVSTFQTSRETVQQTVSLFLGAMAVSQLALGFLADRFGRRSTLIVATVLYTGASAAAVFATDIGFLVAARIAQALGAVAGITVARAIIRDLYGASASASMIGYVTMGMVVAPMVAPVAGAFLDETFGWRSIFVACAALGLAALAAIIAILPETRPAALATTTAGAVFRRMGQLLGRRRFLGYAGASAFASAIFFAFVGAAPYLVIETMRLDKSAYGLWFISIAGSYMLGNYLSGRLSQRVGIDRMVLTGNLISLAGVVILLACSLWLPATPAALFLPMALASVANGLTLPSAIAGSVSVDPQAAGAAAGLAGFLQMGLGGIASFVAAIIAVGSAVPLALFMLAAAVLALLCGALARESRTAVVA